MDCGATWGEVVPSKTSVCSQPPAHEEELGALYKGWLAATLVKIQSEVVLKQIIVVPKLKLLSQPPSEKEELRFGRNPKIKFHVFSSLRFHDAKFYVVYHRKKKRF